MSELAILTGEYTLVCPQGLLVINVWISLGDVEQIFDLCDAFRPAIALLQGLGFAQGGGVLIGHTIDDVVCCRAAVVCSCFVGDLGGPWSGCIHVFVVTRFLNYLVKDALEWCLGRLDVLADIISWIFGESLCLNPHGLAIKFRIRL